MFSFMKAATCYFELRDWPILQIGSSIAYGQSFDVNHVVPKRCPKTRLTQVVVT